MKSGFFKRLWAIRNQNAWDDFIRKFLSGADVEELDTDQITTAGSTALKYIAVFACNRILSETFASVPLFEYRKISDDERQKTDDTGLYDILHSAPNEEMSAYNFKEMALSQINLGGNFVAKRQKGRMGQILALYPYEWNRVSFAREETGLKRIQYVIDKNAPNAIEKILYRPEVFHVPGPSINGVTGLSAIEYANNAIKLGLTLELMGNKLFKNGTFPSGVFEHPGNLADTAYQRLKEQIDERWAGVTRFGKPLLAEDGLKFAPLKISLIDAQIIEHKRFQLEDVCRIFRVPPHLAQDLERSTNNNIEHQSLEFIMYTMLPHFKRFEECINCQLLTPIQRKEGYYFEFNVASVLRGDQKSMAEAFARGRQWGWLSVNDIRRLLNLNRIDNGDIYLQPINMIEAGSTVNESGENGENGVNSRILDEVRRLIEAKGA